MPQLICFIKKFVRWDMRLVLVLLLLLLPSISLAAPTPKVTFPVLACTYLPDLVKAAKDDWPENPYPWFIAGQVEQETCSSLSSKKCWNPTTTLKTDREYGFGLGQFTITSKFNIYEELKQSNAKLKSWKWEERFNPYYQLIGIITLNKRGYIKIRGSANEFEHQAFSYSTYNGGLGGVLQDRKLCSTTPGCNSTMWFDNVEKYSFKSKTKVKGYGQSFFEINRGYVRNIMLQRSEKYKYAFK